MREERDQAFQARMEKLADWVGNVAELARKSGLSRRVIDKYRNGESDPSRERLVALALAAGVRIEWLANGRGPMVEESSGAQSDLRSADEDARDEMLMAAVIAATAGWMGRDGRPTDPERLSAICVSVHRMLIRDRKAVAYLSPPEIREAALRILCDLAPILGD